ncbi:MAG: SIMPL domain-containing protein [Chloroflexota bacterium]
MRTMLRQAMLITTIVLVGLLCFVPMPTLPIVHAAGPDQLRTISVSGEAQINVVPDEVIITLGVETSDMVLKTAKSQNDDQVAKVLAVAKDNGIAPEKVQTDYLTVEPRYDGTSQQRNFIGFFVRKNIVITLKDLTKFEGLLSGVLDGGANYVNGIQFRTTELRKYRDQARALAIKAAKEKATALAGEVDQKLGKPISISENQAGWFYYGAQNFGNISQNAIQNAQGSAGSTSDSDTSFAPGQIAVTANVNVTFELTD